MSLERPQEMITFGVITIDPNNPRRLQPDEIRTVASAIAGNGKEAPFAHDFYVSYAKLVPDIRKLEAQRSNRWDNDLCRQIPRRLVDAAIVIGAGWLIKENFPVLIDQAFKNGSTDGNASLLALGIVLESYYAFRICSVLERTFRGRKNRQVVDSLIEP